MLETIRKNGVTLAIFAAITTAAQMLASNTAKATPSG
jgi:Na+-translocating ferredoxin:NAD+ oxidoreductase RnfG subunit